MCFLLFPHHLTQDVQRGDWLLRGRNFFMKLSNLPLQHANGSECFSAEAEALLHLTEDTSRRAIPARALCIAAPLSEKQTVQTVLFPEGTCYRKDIGFFAPVTNQLEAVVFQCLLELANHGEAYEMEEVGWWAWDLNHRPRPYQY
jgi:hypothetical protein